MKVLLSLAFYSLVSRKVSVFLTILCISLSIILFSSIDNFRKSAKKTFFSNAKSGDLIISSRSGEIEALLYLIFQIGTPTNNIRWKSFKDIQNHPDVKWAIPISLGDSHKQYRVLGTSSDYFKKIQIKNKKLEFYKGEHFKDIFDVVIGYDVAKTLNYKLNDKIIVAHGISSQDFHDKFPFRINGILKKSGSNADKLIFVSLEALEAIHKDWQGGFKLPYIKPKPTSFNESDLVPKEITGAIIKLNSKIKIFQFKRDLHKYKSEPIQAIIPGLALTKLWQIVSFVEQILFLICYLVIFITLLGMAASIYTNVNQRNREIALLRVVGASPRSIFSILILEGIMISLTSILISILLMLLLNIIFNPILDTEYGIYLEYNFLSTYNIIFYCSVVLISILVGLIPAYRGYKKSLNSGI